MPDRAAGAFDAGADSVCVVTDFLQSEDTVARVKEWLFGHLWRTTTCAAM